MFEASKRSLRPVHDFEHWNFGSLLMLGIWNLVIHGLPSRVILLVDLL